MSGSIRKVCIVGASGKLGHYMIQHCLDRGYELNGVCREESVPKLDKYRGKITIYPGRTDDREVIKEAVKGADTKCLAFISLSTCAFLHPCSKRLYKSRPHFTQI